jgi:hypothetical protein
MFVDKVNVDGVNWGIQSSARNILGSFFPLPLMILKNCAHPDLLIQMGKTSFVSGFIHPDTRKIVIDVLTRKGVVFKKSFRDKSSFHRA